MTEYAEVREGGAGLIDLSDRGRIRVSGSEAVMFLNGLMTNDMKTLVKHRWMPAAEPLFLIDTDAASREGVLKTISRFTMAGDFYVTDVTAQTSMFTVQGKQAAAVSEKVLRAGLYDLPRYCVVDIVWQNSLVTILRATHTSEDGFDIVVEADKADELRQALEHAGAHPVSEETREILRVEAGIARFGRDMDETNVVTETNLDDAVSFTKGCYVGQEIIVRIKHRGHVAKKLTGLRFETDLQIEPGAIIKADGKEIGRVTSTAVSPKVGSIGLGYVRYEYLVAGTKVFVDDEISATVTELPFIRGSWYQD
jgi:folate-binding protein YgfZ